MRTTFFFLPNLNLPPGAGVFCLFVCFLLDFCQILRLSNFYATLNRALLSLQRGIAVSAVAVDMSAAQFDERKNREAG